MKACAPQAGTPGSAIRMAVVVPLANESDTINSFLDRVLAQLGEADRVFCVLDRVSKDDTRQKVEARAAADPRVVLVWAPENRCVVDAYFRGYREALQAGAQWILEMDGGLSHRPEEIARFIDAMGTGVDYAGGCRFMPGGSYSGPWSRYILSKGGTVLTNLLLGTTMRDMTSGFECFSRRAMEAVLKHGVRSRAHFFQTEIRWLLHDWHRVEVPINYINPSKRVGTASIKESFANLWALRREQSLRQKRGGPRRSRSPEDVMLGLDPPPADNPARHRGQP